MCSTLHFLHWPLATGYCQSATGHSEETRFDRVVVDNNFPDGYQVEVADVNGDRKPDIIALGGSTCAWYENPTWKKRIVTAGKQTPGIISSATADLDGDGKAEIAIAYDFEMNEPTRGKLALAIQGSGSDEPWKLVPIADVSSIHRLRWGDIDGDTELDLVVAPIFGRGAKPLRYDDKARIVAFQPQGDPKNAIWRRQPLLEHPVIHAIELRPLPATQGRSAVLTADNEGVAIVGEGIITDGASFTLTVRSLVPGAPGEVPKRGCSEIHLGRLNDGRHFLATIEPWHGSDVVVWPESENGSLKFGSRTVLDSTLADGHALWVADVDGDGDDELFAGHRGTDHRVSMYDFDRSSGKWTRTVLDTKIAAQDLRGGDLDGDGTPDVVAIGGSTHNVIWYRPRRP
ncbi:MAG: VCBS repeat-containing protein [Isosphaeraceae bacterium]